MSSIDERVVEMKFNNAQFQKGVADTNSSLDKLKQGLNLDGAAKGLSGLQAAGNRFSLAHIGAGVEAIGAKFTAMSVVGITALTNLTNKAVNAGIEMAKSFTIAPIAEGFSEYETKLGSIQTILANTSKDGTTLKQVSASLNELNKYADKTIYNFGDMTRNIGLFTNAGIGLEDATSMIKGFSNEAAASGTTAANASGAAYQLSQALSKGKVTLEDFKSLTNVGMGNANMKSGIIEIATAMGTFEGKGTDAAKASKDFNGSLEKGWLTADVMTKYLKIQAGELTKEQMKGIGLTDKQIDAFIKQQKIAQDAATKVRSLTQLTGTLKEAVGSSWATTFELLVGDFDEATVLFTNISNTLGGMINQAGDARNALITGWDKLGGRTVMIQALANVFNSLMAIMKPIGEAFKEIFPPITAQNLMDLTNSFKAFTDKLKPSQTTLDNIKRVAKGLFAALDIGRMIIMGVVGVFGKLLGSAAGAGGGVLDFAAKIGDFLVRVRDAIKNGEGLTEFFRKLGDVLVLPIEGLKKIGQFLGDLFNGMGSMDTSGATAALDNVKNAIKPLASSAEHVTDVWGKLGDVFRGVFEFLKPLGDKIGEWVRGVSDKISSAVGNMDWKLVLDGINTGLFAGLILLIRKFFKGGFKEADEGGGIIQKLKDVFGGMTDTLGQMQNTLKAGTLIAIAIAIALLAASAVALAGVDSGKLTQSLGALAVLFTQLLTAMAIFEKINPTSSIRNMIAIGTGLILLGIAIRILVSSVEALSKLSWEELLKGLVGVMALLGGLAVASKIMEGNNKHMIATGIGLLLVAVAVKILASAVKDFSDMDWQKMMQGLIAVGMVLGGLAIFTQLVKTSKGAVGSAVSLILLGTAIKILASAVSDFADMDWQKMMQGLIAMGMVLGGLAIFSRVVNPAQMVTMGISLVIIAASMKIFASAINDLGSIDWQKMMQGLIAMGLILAGIAIFSRVVNPVQMVGMAVSMVIIAFALDKLADVLKKMGGMSWDEIGKGMVVLAGSLLILAGAMYLMSAGLPGAAAMLIMAAALAVFVPVLQSLGAMSWETIWTGLGALALSVLALGVAGIVLGVLSPLFGLFGIALILVGTGALLAGVGLLAFSVGITALSVAGAAGTAVLVGMVMALAAMLPAIMVQVGLALVAFAQVIIDSAPKFGEAITVVLMTLLTIINTLAPQIVATLWNLVVLLVETLVKGIPYLVTAGMRLIIGILKGIGDNIGKIVDEGARIIVEFLNGLGRNLPKITDAAADLIVKFVRGLSDAVKNHSKEMSDAGWDLAGNIIQGMVNGIGDGINRVAEAAKNIANSALDTVKGWLGIKSPSREFKKLGAFSTEGFALGLNENNRMIVKSAQNVGQTAISTLKNTMSNMSAMSNIDMNINPTIKPVLDLSDVKSKSAQLTALMTPPKLSVDGSYAKAASLVERERANREAASAKTEVTAETATGDQYVYNQTINSPKAISSAETYRNTKNLISMAKDTTKKGAPTA